MCARCLLPEPWLKSKGGCSLSACHHGSRSRACGDQTWVCGEGGPCWRSSRASAAAVPLWLGTAATAPAAAWLHSCISAGLTSAKNAILPFPPGSENSQASENSPGRTKAGCSPPAPRPRLYHVHIDQGLPEASCSYTLLT